MLEKSRRVRALGERGHDSGHEPVQALCQFCARTSGHSRSIMVTSGFVRFRSRRTWCGLVIRCGRWFSGAQSSNPVGDAILRATAGANPLRLHRDIIRFALLSNIGRGVPAVDVVGPERGPLSCNHHAVRLLDPVCLKEG